jgi:hypothetical protein
MTSVQIKAYLQGSVRRFTVNTNTTFEQLSAQVKKFYPEHVESVAFQWLDEEDDLVSFSTNHEWKNALDSYVDLKQKLLRIKVVPNANRRPVSAPRAPLHRHQPLNEIEQYVARAAPLIKQLFGVDLEIETEEVEPKTEEKQEEQAEEIVVPEEENEQVNPLVEEPVESKPVEQPVKFAAELETLANMGFTNVQLNAHLIENYQGDLIRVVNALLQLSKQ